MNVRTQKTFENVVQVEEEKKSYLEILTNALCPIQQKQRNEKKRVSTRRTRRHRRSSATADIQRRRSSTIDALLDPKSCVASILSESPWLIAYGSTTSTSMSLLHDLRESLNTSVLAGTSFVIETVMTNMSRVLPVARNLERALEDGDPDASGLLASQLASMSELLQIEIDSILKKEQERAAMLAKMDMEAMKNTEVEIDPFEPRILSGGNDYNLKIWSVDTERVRHSVVSGDWPKKKDSGGVVVCIAVSNKADLVATADGDGRIRLYTLPDPKLVYVFNAGPVKCVVFSSDDRYLYSGGE